MDDAQRRALPGTRYSLLRPLGEGAMGEVFLGEHDELGKRVVIKVLRAQLSQRGDLVARLRQEARLLAQIRHPALVDIYDLAVSADGRPFFVMEYIEGWNLRDYLAGAGGRLEAPAACELIAQALDGLDAAHQRGIVHRDIKPENLFVANDGRVKILDFGVAKVVGEGQQPQTAAGLVVGTPRYMSPEQAKGDKLTAATDLYAIGCVLFELLSGARPFSGNTPRELLLKHIGEEAPSMSTRARGYFDPDLEEIVALALAKDPKKRPPSASVMALQLRRISARLTGKTTSVADDKPTVQVDLHRAAMSAAAAVDPISSTTTSGISSPITPPIVVLTPSPTPAALDERPTQKLPHDAAIPSPSPVAPMIHVSQPIDARTPPTRANPSDDLAGARTELAPAEGMPRRSSAGVILGVAFAGALLLGGVGLFVVLGRGKSERAPTIADEPAATPTLTPTMTVEEHATPTPATTAPTLATSSEPDPTSSSAPTQKPSKPPALATAATKPTTNTSPTAASATTIAAAAPSPAPAAAKSAPPAGPKPSGAPAAMDDRN